MSFQNGLSGLNASSEDLSVIGNNVANVNTVGAKAGRTEFAAMYANSLYGQGGGFNGIGVAVSQVQTQFTQGDISSSSNPLDIAINGNGFFQVSKNGALAYTRDGEFQLDKNSNIVTASGAKLMGYAANANGQILDGVPTELQLNTQDLAPQATTTGKMQLNIDSREAVNTTPAFVATDPTTYNGATSFNVYDQQGNAHPLTLYFRKTADNTWNVYGTSDNGTALNGGAALTTLNFGASGALTSPTTPLALSVPAPAAVGGSVNMTLDLTQMTQFGSSFAVNSKTIDGYAPGQVSGFSIAADGTIQANYTNGQSKVQGQIVLATFANVNGLQAQGGNTWVETSTSGQPLMGVAGSGALGVLQSGALEGSNVDLTSELVDMITAQRSYQANAQTIKTQDQVLQTLLTIGN